MRTRWMTLGGIAATAAAAFVGVGPVGAAVSNVALHKTVGADEGIMVAPTCTAGSGPEKAVDGHASNIYTDKWCVPSGQPELGIQLDTGFGYRVSQIVIKHAGAGGERTSLNTRAYTLAVTQMKKFDASNLLDCAALGVPSVCEMAKYVPVDVPVRTTIATVTNNTASITTHNFTNLNNVQDVWLTINVPTQGTNPATRIYEVEVYGTPETAYP